MQAGGAGLQLTFPEEEGAIEPLYLALIQACMDPEPSLRPTLPELHKLLSCLEALHEQVSDSCDKAWEVVNSLAPR